MRRRMTGKQLLQVGFFILLLILLAIVVEIIKR